MPYVTTEEIQAAKRVDLLSYLQTQQPDELVKLSGGTYCTKEHDSLKISNGKWNWFSRGFGGTTALDYLIKVQGYSFPEAVQTILGSRAIPAPVSPHTPKAEPERCLCLPERDANNEAVIRYLTGRGIDRDILRHCMAQGQVYESRKYHNAVFVGFDSSGTARYAMLRGTYGDFKGEAGGSDKRFGFLLANQADASAVHLFESPIDALSYATLLKMKGRDWQYTPLLSLGGVFKKGKEKGTVPAALESYLSSHAGTRSILLHLDNDDTGRGAAALLQEELSARYQVVDSPAPFGKDVNEYLTQRIARQIQKKREVAVR